MIPPPDIWGAPFRRLACGPTKLERTKGFVNLVNINERIVQGVADSWDQAARAVFVFLRHEHCRVFLGDDFVVVQRRAGY